MARCTTPPGCSYDTKCSQIYLSNIQMNLNVFTLVHILISLVGILSGLVVLGGWLAGREYARLTALFLVTTILTSATGFFFPLKGFTPAVGVGILSLILLAIAVFALYGRKLAGGWRKIYVITALTALYFNFFVLVAQMFQKVPALKELAPTQTEPPFGAAQVLVLVIFLVLGFGAVRGYRSAPGA